MSWVVPLFAIFGGLFAAMLAGIPVAFAFILVTAAGIAFFQGLGAPFLSYILSMETSVTTFTLLPIPLFVLMGEILWQSNIATNALGALDKLIGRVPGRLSLLTVASGTVFSALSGSTMANTAILGKLLLPEMLRKNYSGQMSMGPIMASGALSMLIPPSALAVIYATIAQVSIGGLLIALILPGIVMALLYVIYIVGRCVLDPSLAPPDDKQAAPLAEALRDIAIYVLPLGLVVFAVVGVIFLGIATPTEAAALGCVVSLLLAIAYGGMTFRGFASALEGTVRITAMMLIIMASAMGFSQLLAFTGVSRGMLEFVMGLSVDPTTVILLIMLIVLVLGFFMEEIAIMLITLPIFIPILKAMGVDQIWFAVMMLINLNIGLMSPPFGLLLFVMKGVAPPDTTMTAIYRAALPYMVINSFVILLVLWWPQLALLLPEMSK